MIFPFTIFLFSLTFLSIFLVKLTSGSSLCESVNVKTVLWKATDTCRKCWGKQDLLKAYARRVVQDLLPRRVPRNMPLLLQYLTMSWEQVMRKTAEGSVERYVLTVALADTIGGYLQAVALPIANEAYYAGNVDYKVMAQLYYLFEELKMELGTDGGGWSKPCDMKRIPTRVSALDLTGMCDAEDVESCKDLHIPIKNPNSKNATCATNEVKATGKDYTTKIPLPFLDDDQHPNAIAVPLRDQLLYSLHSMSSAHILVRYYITALRCIGKKDRIALLKFNHAFYQWIIVNVVPHLHEKNKWYVGFGSVMRIIETMHQKGWSPPPECPGCSGGSNGGGNGRGNGGGNGDNNGGGGGRGGGGGGGDGGGGRNGGGDGGAGGNPGPEHGDRHDGKPNLPPTPPTTPSTPKTTGNAVIDGGGGISDMFYVLLLLLAFLLCFCCCCLCILRKQLCGEDESQYVPLLSLYYKIMKGNEEGDEGAGSKYSDFDDNATGATVNTERGPSNVSLSKQYASETDETTTGTSESDDRMPRKRAK